MWVTHPLRQIPFKIALAFTVTTLCLAVGAELLFAGVAAWMLIETDNIPNAYASEITADAGTLRDTFQSNPGRLPSAKQLALTERLYTINSQIESNFLPLQFATLRHPTQITAVMDTKGRVVAYAPGAPFQAGKPLMGQLAPDDAVLVRTFAFFPANRGGLARRDTNGGIFAAAPIVGTDGKAAGLLMTRISEGPSIQGLATWTFFAVLFTVPLVLLFGGTAGAISGAAATRPLTRRLQAMSGAALAWGQGDFAVTIKDRSGDEIGELGRRLGAMSGELQRHIRAQQQLAALEERNRLALDLHDTVKQQAFAAAMQLGAARTVLAGDSGPAVVFVSQAEKLVNKVQEDLMTLIHELRPSLGSGVLGATVAANTNLSAQLREEVLDWSQSSGIPANLGEAKGISVTEDICQALIRITQEALANVARHSGASRVEVDLRQGDDSTVHITLSDNGKGFDPIFTPRGMGLYIMRDRALSLPSGQFSLETAPEAGVTIRVSCAGGTLSNA
ncbi:MAG: histidine kinase [Janthinobacterium lividum]